MGVHGLWKLIEPSGQMVPLESLAGKVLAVDVSIWLHQAVKGMHDAHGAPLAVAHLLILFHRVCKLLFYKIKPVFVFDGGVPALKRQTMAARRQRSNLAKNEAMKVREKLIKNLLKHEAVRHMLSDEAASAALGLNSFTLPGPSVEEDLYKLPPIAADCVDSEYSEEASSSGEESEKHAEDIHSIDVTSKEFLNLPAEIRHDILTDLIETRKQSSWKHLDSMPKNSDNFSDFQMNRLLKRHAVQTSLEKAGKEMGGRALSLKELESLLGDQGVLDPKIDIPSKRIAQDSVTRFMLVQKDAEEVSDTKNGQKFDIMNHIEDVEWSSESDTDVILEKPLKKQKDLIKADEEGESAGKMSCLKEEKSKDSCLISNKPKVRMTEEVANILSILEDEDAAADVKVRVENLQAKIDFKESPVPLKTSESEENETKSNESSVLLDVAKPTPPFSESGQTEISQFAVPVQVTDVENTRSVEVKVKPELETTSETPTSNKTADSSSDSENDFIAITTEATDGVLRSSKQGKEHEEPEVFEKNPDALTVVIKPSEVGEKDDLFADIFNPVRQEGKSSEVVGVEEVEKEEAKERYEIDEDLKKQISEGNLNELKKTLEEQHSEFLKEKGKQERLALNMTDQVYTDAQELLRLFGIPFVVAPMEAEAQCATLNIIGLTEGTITDDSDIWLFGGKVVYKNFFNQQKHVLEYRSEAIHKYFKLTRDEMIKMALLVGSDYTVGLTGIGPVTALEIIAAFQNPNHGLLDCLLKFRDWFTGASPGGPPRVTLRKKIRNTVITPGFPSRAVVEAYLHPQVDDSKEPFSWAKPNLELIHKYVRAKLGWSAEKCNELLQPVMKKLEENSSQTTIDKHFKINQKSSSIDGVLSKRVENAIKRLGGEPDEQLGDAMDVKPQKKRKTNSRVEKNEDKVEETSKSPTKPTSSCSYDFGSAPKSSALDESSKIKLINKKLHQSVKVPQKEMAQKILEEKKKEAVKIFRTYGKGKRKRTRVYAKEQANLSESSSEDD